MPPKKGTKSRGKGLTMSRAYHRAWVLPVRVHVCRIDRIIPNLYTNELRRINFVQDYDQPPKQMYHYPTADPRVPYFRTELF